MGVEIRTFPYEFFNAGEIKVGLFEQTERHAQGSRKHDNSTPRG